MPPNNEDVKGLEGCFVASNHPIADEVFSETEEGRGVEFSENPSKQPWGIRAQFKDQDGNEFGLIERD